MPKLKDKAKTAPVNINLQDRYIIWDSPVFQCKAILRI